MSTFKSLIRLLGLENRSMSQQIEAPVRNSLQPEQSVVAVGVDRPMMKACLAGCLAFVPGSVVILLWGEGHDPLAISLSGAAFGLFAVVAAVSLLPGSCHLELNPQGFISTRLFRKREYHWRDVVGFTAISTHEGPDVVGFDLVASRPHRRIVRFISTVDMTLPSYAVSAPDLAAALNLWRQRYAPVLNEQLTQR